MKKDLSYIANSYFGTYFEGQNERLYISKGRLWANIIPCMHSVLEALLKPRFKIKTNFSWSFLQNILTYTEATIKKELENWRFIFMQLLLCQIWPYKNQGKLWKKFFSSTFELEAHMFMIFSVYYNHSKAY